MTTHTRTLPAGKQGKFGARSVWAAVAVLGVVVIALGASLIHVQTRPVDGHSVFVPTEPLAVDPPAAATRLPVNTVAPDETVVPAVPARATPDAATRPAEPTPQEAPAAKPAAEPSAAYGDAASTARTAGEAPPAAPLPEAMPAPGTPAVAAPYVVTESGVVNTGRPGQTRAKVYGTD